MSTLMRLRSFSSSESEVNDIWHLPAIPMLELIGMKTARFEPGCKVMLLIVSTSSGSSSSIWRCTACFSSRLQIIKISRDNQIIPNSWVSAFSIKYLLMKFHLLWVFTSIDRQWGKTTINEFINKNKNGTKQWVLMAYNKINKYCTLGPG